MIAVTAAPSASRLLAGYQALARPATLADHLARYGPPPAGPGRRSAHWLIDAVDRAGLTGRGGGAFPTGRKLRSVAAARRAGVVVVNAAEGEPASAKDRVLLGVAPHLVLDGAALAAAAIGAREIVVCVHADGGPGTENTAGSRPGGVRASRAVATAAGAGVRVRRAGEAGAEQGAWARSSGGARGPGGSWADPATGRAGAAPGVSWSGAGRTGDGVPGPEGVGDLHGLPGPEGLAGVAGPQGRAGRRGRFGHAGFPDPNDLGGHAGHVRRAVAERERGAPAHVPTRVLEVPPRYVASEETSLVGWINGGEARPAFTPPRPFERGVGGRPTLVANAETYAQIALIARYGPEWFRSCGAPDAPGTALFTVSGAVHRPGVVEAPLGTPVGDVLRLAGGPAEPLQAVLTGGYGGAWLPAALLDTPATPSALAAAGGAFGPGILVALPERACGVAESARILAWLAGETAGQCGPCVFGLPAIAADLMEVARGGGGAAVYTRLERRLAVIPGRGACRHPDGAVRFAASALRVFGGHLRAHARPGGCPAAGRPPVLRVPERG